MNLLVWPGDERAGDLFTDRAVELNEASAVQSLARVDAWFGEGLKSPEIVNACGGAIGYLLGASGGRTLRTLAHRLPQSGDHWGVTVIWIGVGQALTVVLGNVA